MKFQVGALNCRRQKINIEKRLRDISFVKLFQQERGRSEVKQTRYLAAFLINVGLMLPIITQLT